MKIVVPEYELLKAFNSTFDDTVNQILGLYDPERHFVKCCLCGRAAHINNGGVDMDTGLVYCKECKPTVTFDPKYFAGLQVACGKRSIELSENFLFLRNRRNKLLTINTDSVTRQHWCNLLYNNNNVC